MSKILHLITVLLLVSGCVLDEKTEIPGYIREYKNMTIFPADADPAMKIELVWEAAFGSTDEVLTGNFFPPAVDASGRVYLGDTGDYTVRVFAPDGSYLTQIGRQGQGPGEFLGPPFPSIRSEKLFVYDHMQLRVSIYSIDKTELSRTINLNPRNQFDIEDLIDRYIARIFFRNDGRFMAAFGERLVMDPNHPKYNLEDERSIKYYLLDDEGRILPVKLFEQKETKYVTATVRGEFKFARYPFLAKSLIAVSDDGHIFSANSNEFLIELRNPDGEYQRAFYHPIEKREFARQEALRLDFGYIPSERLEKDMKDVLRNASEADLPAAWPVLDDLIVDDENRLWVSTVVVDDEIYEWWVLEESGEVITRFEWPRNEPIEVVKNGYMYTRETDEETGLQQVVRYRIEMEEV